MQGSSFRNMAAGLGKDPSTISKEIRLHCAVAPNGTYRFPHCTACSKYKKCKDIVYLCTTCKEILCWRCSANRDLARNCKEYNPFTCPKLAKPPYVCNGSNKYLSDEYSGSSWATCPDFESHPSGSIEPLFRQHRATPPALETIIPVIRKPLFRYMEITIPDLWKPLHRFLIL